MKRLRTFLCIIALFAFAGLGFTDCQPGGQYVDMQYGHWYDRPCYGCNRSLIRHGTWKTYYWPPDQSLDNITKWCNAEVANDGEARTIYTSADFCWAPWNDPTG